MIKVSVYSGDTLTNQASFDTQELSEAWVAYHNFGGSVVYEDVTEKLEKEKKDKEAKELKKSEAKLYLATLDLKGTTIAALRAELEEALGHIITLIK